MDFTFKNPNSSLIGYGIIYIILGLITYFFAPAVSLGFALIVKIFILLWISQAAKLVGRNPVTWTIFCYLSPSIGLITLGAIGYKKAEGSRKLLEECSKMLNNYNKDLNEQLEKGKIDAHGKQIMLDNYMKDLQSFAEKQLAMIFKTDDDGFLTEQLEKRGFVLDNDSDVFVKVEGKCPACGMKLGKNDKKCPDCGLNLFQD